MSDSRDFFEPAHKYLPEDVACDLALASTTRTWWMRLRRLFDADREEIKRLQAMVDALGQQICEYHDTNPLNETVVKLDSEDYLHDNEVLIGGEVWEVREQLDPDWLCEEDMDEEFECPERAVVELHFHEEDCDGSYHATKALCQAHFEELTRKK